MRKARTRYQSSAPRYLPRARERETHGHVSREAGAAGGGADAGGRSVRGRWCGRQAEALALVRAAGGGAPRLGRADQPRLAGHDRQAVGEVAAHCGGLVDRHWRHRHRAIGAAPEEERGPKWVVLARHDAVDLVAARAAPRQHLAPALAVGLDAHLVAREQQVRRRLEVAVRPLAARQQPLGARRVVHLPDLLEHGGVLLRLLGHRARCDRRHGLTSLHASPPPCRSLAAASQPGPSLAAASSFCSLPGGSFSAIDAATRRQKSSCRRRFLPAPCSACSAQSSRAASPPHPP